MTQTKGQNFQSVQDGALPRIGAVARTENETIIDRFDTTLEFPFRLSSSFPAIDSKLNISGSNHEMGDSTGRSSAPVDDIVNSFPDTSIDFDTVTVSGGTVTVEGSAFSLPATTFGEFRRFAMVYQSVKNRIDCVFSSPNVLVSGLDNPGNLFSRLDGQPLGWVDLEAFDTGGAVLAFKTAGSADGIIEPKVGSDVRINQFFGEVGSFDYDDSFKLLSVSTNIARIKKGFVDAGGKQLVTYDGSNDRVNLSLNLKTEVHSAGITAPAASTTYFLYIDLNIVAGAPDTTVGESLTPAFRVQKGVAGQLIVLATAPHLVDRTRYIHIASIRTDGSSNYEFGSNLGRRVHQIPETSTPFDTTYVADPSGTVAHGQGVVPTDVRILHNELADGRYVQLDPSNFVKSDTTNMYLDFSALLIDGTHQLRIIAKT